MAESTDVQRIASYLGGDEAAFREVDGWVRRELESRYPVLHGDVEDLCQVVHAKLLANLRGSRFHQRCTLRTYVTRIANYTAIDMLRVLYRERAWAAEARQETEVPAGNPYRALASREERGLLHQVLLRASPACRELWRMVFLEKLSYEEIARRLSIPPGTVKSRMWHCRRKAQGMLERIQGRGPRAAPPGRKP